MKSTLFAALVAVLFLTACANIEPAAPVQASSDPSRTPGRLELLTPSGPWIVGQARTLTAQGGPEEVLPFGRYEWFVNGRKVEGAEGPQWTVAFDSKQTGYLWVEAHFTVPRGVVAKGTYVEVTEPLQQSLAKAESQRPAKNIILVIGDGMGPVQRIAGDLFDRPAEGLRMDDFPIKGLLKTNNSAGEITDSAAGATAYSAGIKTLNGRLAFDVEGKPVETILEYVRARGKAVGLVTTTPLGHATPAAFASHIKSREDYFEIARQFILEQEVNVLLGGGEEHFYPRGKNGTYPGPSKRADKLDLVEEAKARGFEFVDTSAALGAFQPDGAKKLLGLFGDFGMNRPYDPSLELMARKAVETLSLDPEGFFLMVEGGQIDWAGHSNESENLLHDMVSLDRTVEYLKKWAAGREDTLIIVTADHETGGLIAVNTPLADRDAEGPFGEAGSPVYVKWTSKVHTGVDVPVTASGPFAWLLSGVHENTEVYRAMRSAADGKLFP